MDFVGAKSRSADPASVALTLVGEPTSWKSTDLSSNAVEEEMRVRRWLRCAQWGSRQEGAASDIPNTDGMTESGDHESFFKGETTEASTVLGRSDAGDVSSNCHTKVRLCRSRERYEVYMRVRGSTEGVGSSVVYWGQLDPFVSPPIFVSKGETFPPLFPAAHRLNPHSVQNAPLWRRKGENITDPSVERAGKSGGRVPNHHGNGPWYNNFHPLVWPL